MEIYATKKVLKPVHESNRTSFEISEKRKVPTSRDYLFLGKFIIVEINGIVSLGQKWSPQIGKSGTVN